MELSTYNTDFEGLSELIIIEQFFQTCGKGIQIYLKEKYPLTLDEIIRVAESYVTAHGGWFFNCKSSTDESSDKTLPEGKVEDSVKAKSARGNTTVKYGDVGHKSFQCSQRNKAGG